MTFPVWHAQMAEKDLAGAALSSSRGAELVVDALDRHLRGSRLRRVIEAAVAWSVDASADLEAAGDVRAPSE